MIIFKNQFLHNSWFYGVMVSTQDFESCDPSSNLGRTYTFFWRIIIIISHYA